MRATFRILAGAGVAGVVAAVVVMWVSWKGDVDPAGATIGLASLIVAAVSLWQSRTGPRPLPPAVDPAVDHAVDPAEQGEWRGQSQVSDSAGSPRVPSPAASAPAHSPAVPAATDRRALPDAATLTVPVGLPGLPRPPAAVFLGRRQVLTRLRKTLTTTPKTPARPPGRPPAGSAGVEPVVITQAAVYGLGGIGKSELALQYAARHRGAYRLVWWIDADTPAQIQTSLAGLTRAICAGADSVAASAATVEEAADWALAWLAAHPGWLLVFDNVEDERDLRPYLGRLTGGHVLITTRRDTGWTDMGCTPISLEVLDPEPARQLLTRMITQAHPTRPPGRGAPAHKSGPAEPADLAGLAEDLGFLPLALTQAAAFIARTPAMNVTTYRTLLRDNPGKAHAAAPPGGDGERVLAQVWTITRARIAAQNPLAPHLLALLACYAPDQLPITVLHHLPDALPDVDELQIGQALGLLASYSMITISPDNTGRGPGCDTVSVHRLVQAVTVNDLPEHERQTVHARAADLLTAELPADPNVIDNWPLYRLLLAHARAALPPRSPAMSRVIDYLDASGDYATAKTLQHQRYQAQLNHHGPEHPETLTDRANLASCTGRVGDVAGARDQFAALLPITERVSGAEHPDTLTARANLAYWSGEAGDPAGARDQFAALLPLRERISGTEHPETLTARANLARWSGEAGDPAGARDQFAALLPLRERVSGAEHPETLTARANLAYWSGQAGDAAGARDQCAALLPISERVLGAEHPDTLTARANLAYWSGEAGDPAGARDQFAALLPLRERISGTEHPETLAVRADLARWSGEAGDAAGARDQFAALLPLRERISGTEHPETLTAQANLARWSGEAGDPAGARDQFAALLPLRERISGTEHPETLTAQADLAYWARRCRETRADGRSRDDA
ncbi:tetratricopeptide repeat protein [Nonomuraea gerenzanensis]|uniref:tetratricopeptide repeat protein n=1 Tax=Nonomuraea gerenzanensis TaxID=93944 RepID=UPI001CD95025|nr:tetratricopeptide repeat protein [Nonomuraea gerenzanensis]UBU18187.1 tetratricopeptide repeat protein [Nonomuraea gerenzanensis]